jgi:hypothetical protein
MVEKKVFKEQTSGPFTDFVNAEKNAFMQSNRFEDVEPKIDIVNEAGKHSFFSARADFISDFYLEYGYTPDNVLIKRSRQYFRDRKDRILTHAKVSFKEQDQLKEYELIGSPGSKEPICANLSIRLPNNKNIIVAFASYSGESSCPKNVYLATDNINELGKHYAKTGEATSSIMGHLPGITLELNKDTLKYSLSIFPKPQWAGILRQGEPFESAETLPFGYRYDKSVVGDKITVTRMDKIKQNPTRLLLPGMDLTNFSNQVRGPLKDCAAIYRDYPINVVNEKFFGA